MEAPTRETGFTCGNCGQDAAWEGNPQTARERALARTVHTATGSGRCADGEHFAAPPKDRP